LPHQPNLTASARSPGQTLLQPVDLKKRSSDERCSPSNRHERKRHLWLGVSDLHPGHHLSGNRPYNQNANVRFHSWQSIFLTIAAIAAMFLRIVLAFIPFIGLLISMLITLGFFILWLILMINAFNGKRINIPLLSDLAAKQAGA
jgi:uncharacterized membrane protein